jgi:hypothetical protein
MAARVSDRLQTLKRKLITSPSRTSRLRPRAAADGPGPALVLSRGQEGDEAQESVGRADDAVEAGLLEAEVLAERPRVLRGKVGHLRLDGSGDGTHAHVGPRGEGGEAGALQEARGVLDVSFSDVHGEKHGLLGEEGVVAEAAPLLVGERELAERTLSLEVLLHLLEEGALRHVLRLVGLLDVGVQALQAPVHGGEVGEDQLELQHPGVAEGVDRPVGMGDPVRGEGPHDVEECVHPPQGGQVHESRPLPLGDARDVHVLHRRVGLLLGVEEGGERVHPPVRDPRDPHASLGAAARRGGALTRK